MTGNNLHLEEWHRVDHVKAAQGNRAALESPLPAGGDRRRPHCCEGSNRPLLLAAFAVLLTSPLLPNPAALAVEPALRAAAGPCIEGICGTCVKFLNNPVAAAGTAGKNQKLLFVLHVSGNFEDSRFT